MKKKRNSNLLTLFFLNKHNFLIDFIDFPMKCDINTKFLQNKNQNKLYNKINSECEKNKERQLEDLQNIIFVLFGNNNS